MVLLLHGAAGGWDELAIAAIAVAVLWFAVKLAGRKPAAEDEEESVSEGAAPTDQERSDPAQLQPRS